MTPAEEHGIRIWAALWSTNAALVSLGYALNAPVRKDAFKYLPMLLSMCLAIFIPWLSIPNTSENAFVRALLALTSAFYFFRVSECTTESRFQREQLWIRIAHFGLTFSDVQKRRYPQHKWRRVLERVVDVLLDLISIFITSSAIDEARSRKWERIAAPLCGAIYAFFSLKLFGHIIQLLFITFTDFETNTLMRDVSHSSTLREFWGYRWDLAIQELLRSHVYDPVVGKSTSKLRRNFAVACTFAASGVIHVTPVYAGLPKTHPKRHALALLMFSYFMAQLGFVLLEDVLALKRKSWLVRKTFVFFAAFAPAPCLYYPVMALVNAQT